MATDLTISIGQDNGSGLWLQTEGLTLADLQLRVSPYVAAAYTASAHLGDGIYKFASVASGEYKVYYSGSELTKFGIIKHGEGDAFLKAGNNTATGANTFSGVNTFSNAAGVTTDDITERTATAGVTIDGVLLKDDLTTSDICSLSGTQTIAGVKTFSALPESSVAPSTSGQLVNKNYVDTQIAALNISVYQQGGNIRRIIYGGTEEAGKVYSSIALAVANIGVTTASDRYTILLERGQADANYANIFPVSHSTLSSLSPGYLTIRGKSRNETELLLGDSGDVATLTNANLILEDMTIYMTDELITTARSYNSITFSNCTIYAWENLTMASCKLINCFVISANPSTVTISGSGTSHYLNSQFTASVIESGGGFLTNYTDSLDSTPTMPDKPNLGS